MLTLTSVSRLPRLRHSNLINLYPSPATLIICMCDALMVVILCRRCFARVWSPTRSRPGYMIVHRLSCCMSCASGFGEPLVYVLVNLLLSDPMYIRSRNESIHEQATPARLSHHRNIYEKSGSASTMLFAIFSSSLTLVEDCDGDCQDGFLATTASCRCDRVSEFVLDGRSAVSTCVFGAFSRDG